MSEGEVHVLRRDIESLSKQTEFVTRKLEELTTAVHESQLILKMAVGNGQPGEGRLGILEKVVEDLKKFKWQALAIVSLILLAVEHSGALGELVRR